MLSLLSTVSGTLGCAILNLKLIFFRHLKTDSGATTENMSRLEDLGCSRAEIEVAIHGCQ